ncbi:hypothetical protein QR680_009706 [Steinernema hermaphroditum]|uniref:Uncharacterized protein n=1 Tax=Steinernema hermaphroditum TaxID=289476 RepID=A0AA39IMS0_9BILA|nr:hypothetical protein QR680_009706 [Steinernema hermaphroditum]
MDAWKKPRVLKRKRTQRNENSSLSVTLASDDSQSLPPISSGDKENAEFGDNPFLKYQQSIEYSLAKKKKLSDVSEEAKSTEAQAKALPVDMRPADKLRLVSQKPLPWMKSMNGPGTSIARANIGDFNELLLSSCRDLRDNDVALMEELLRSAAIYHQYPDLTGVALFPRLEEHTKVSGNFKNADDTRPLCNSPEQFFIALKAAWCDSFNDLYRSWRRNRGQTSFYVFCPQFTVLFAKMKPPSDRNEGDLDLENSCWMLDDEGPRHVVIISPTLHGFRDVLKKEGIDYYHIGPVEKPATAKPARRSITDAPTNFANFDAFKDDSTEKSPVTQSQPAPAKSESSFDLSVSDNEDEDGAISDEGHDSDSADWLRDIGIDSPNRTFKLRRCATVGELSQPSSNIASGTTVADETLRSSIAIWNPSSIQNFCDFFLYTNHGRSVTGPQAGLVPTLASCSPFLNSAMKSLTLSSHCAKSPNGGPLKYVLELDDGPILPHTVANVVKFMKHASDLNHTENAMELLFNSRNFYTGFNQAADKEKSEFSDVERCDMKCPGFSFSW